MGKYLDELIDKYEHGEISDEAICDNITRITRKEEYINDAYQNRIKKLVADKYFYLPYSKSPEDIVIQWEESEKILHFINWIRCTLSEKEWWVFSQYNLLKRKQNDIAQELGISYKQLNNKLNFINHKIKKVMPFYTEQFGDIREYLLN